MTEYNGRSLEELIRRAVGEETARFDAEQWKRKYREEVSKLEERKKNASGAHEPGRRAWRNIMDTRWAKIAAAGAVAAVVAIVAGLWSQGGSGVAMAAVVEQLRGNSYRFVMEVATEEGASASVNGMVLEPGRLRLEQEGGLGRIVSIVDVGAGDSLLLWERFGAAYRFDDRESEQLGALGFLVRPGRSVADLWELRAGDERELGTKEIEGLRVRGFEVVHELAEAEETITVWADAATAAPVVVEVEWRGEDGALDLRLSEFEVVSEPARELFSTELPAGYTLADRRRLEELSAGKDEATAGEGEKVLAALEQWRGGEKGAAVEALAEIDWEGEMRFAGEEHMFTMTEREYISLVSADQQKVMAEAMSRAAECRAATRELVERAGRARAAGDDALAERYLLAGVGLGRVVGGDAERMVIVRMVGIAMQRVALEELVALYEARGDAGAAQEARAAIEALAAEAEAIKRRATGQ